MVLVSYLVSTVDSFYLGSRMLQKGIVSRKFISAAVFIILK